MRTMVCYYHYRTCPRETYYEIRCTINIYSKNSDNKRNGMKNSQQTQQRRQSFDINILQWCTSRDMGQPSVHQNYKRLRTMTTTMQMTCGWCMLGNCSNGRVRNWRYFIPGFTNSGKERKQVGKTRGYKTR